MDPTGSGFAPPPAWSIAAGQMGRFFILAGAVLFLYAVVSNLIGRKLPIPGKWAFVGGCVCILGAMSCLMSLFVTDQFQFEYVYSHSWHDVASMYKVAAVWAGQQGSFLLWATTSAIFGVLALSRTGPYQRWYIVVYSLFLGALCGILAYETPFGRVLFHGARFTPPDGVGLNPSLQNYWVVVHPPTIFSGFGSLTVPFAFAVSAMLTGDLKEWMARVRPWVLLSLAILGLGVVMGGLWAYETQGWGGFWAWDPVENVSFVPWLFMAVLVHGFIVQSTRGRWHGTNLLLAGLPFLLFVYGTFLTRSGYLSKFSVHSFAEMNRSALSILFGFMILMMVGYVALWATRGIKLGKQNDKPFKDDGFNREKAYQIGVLLLTGLATTIAIGMSVPFFAGLLGGEGKVVDEPLYHSVVVWFFMPIMALMGAAPFLSWRRMTAVAFWGRVANVLGITIGILGVMMMVLKLSDWSVHSQEMAAIDFPFGILAPRFTWVMCLFGLTIFTAVANLWRLVELFRRSKMGVGGFLAHLGVATALAGLILSRGLEQKAQILVAKDAPGSGLGYTIRYKGLTSNPIDDRDNKAEFEVSSGDGKLAGFLARPGFFFVPGENGQAKAFTWPHIQHELTHDVYLALHDPVTSYWREPEIFAVGETKEDNGMAVTYLGMTTHGKPGDPESTVGAKIRIVENGTEYPVVEPQINERGEVLPVHATPNFNVALVKAPDEKKAVAIELLYTKPIYPIELFYKPMTMLVWAGTGILTFGGLLSAFYRRGRKRKPDLDDVETEDAPLPAAKS